jgi:hypothetical protein
MVDEEVENTLREIRERVRKTAEFEANSPVTVVSSAPSGSNTARNESGTKTAETMARIDAYLTTTARAWDRLPPLVSKRSGGLARLELWVKRRFKQATRWYSWEQINFNAAVHHALRDTLDALLDLEQQREDMRAKMEARLEQHQIEMLAQRAEMDAHRAQLETEQRARISEMSARLTDLARELREREGQRLDEHRVSYSQLSLEMSEAEVLLDRARRDIEARLDKLESSKRKS